MTTLSLRRSTFEAAWWSAAASEPALTMRNGAAHDIRTRGDRVSGVVVDGELMEADVVIVAAGRLSHLGDRYRAPGESSLCGFSHASRMYRAKDGVDPPSSPMPIGAAYPGYHAGVFPQDDRTFSLLIGRPTAETALTPSRYTDAFEAAIRQIPNLTPWTAELLRLIAHDGNDPRGAAEQFDAWCIEHIRPWYEDHVYTDASRVARDLGEALDINVRLPSDVICAAAEQDTSMLPVVGSFLTMVSLSASLKEVEESSRAVLRSCWRPPYADGPSAAELAEVIASTSPSIRATAISLTSSERTS
jgi:hypothetical protein